MATVKQYSLNLWKVQRTVMKKLGLDIAWAGPAEKVPAMASAVMLATLVKILTDKGVVTDAELNTAYTTVRDADFPIVWPAPPPMGEGEPEDPDLGA